jgi:hypothetical protein
MRTLSTVIAAGLCLATALGTGRADACAAMFVPPSGQPVKFAGHRVAFAVSPTRTVLWHQLTFDGPPGEFSWVLPVKKGARLELSTDAWFEALDTFTTTRIYEPELQCARAESEGESGCSSESADAQTGAPSAGTPGGVAVLHQGSVGPYETVTLASADPNALEAWLEKHGYSVPDEARPSIAAYVAEGFDFIALRLAPGEGTAAMEPVRVVTPGGDPSLPLRLAGVGARERVPMTLFVIGTTRYTLQSLPELTVPFDTVAWDFRKHESNYFAVRSKAFAQAAGSAFLTAFSAEDAFRAPRQAPWGGYASFQVGETSGYFGAPGVQQLGQLYFEQANENVGAKDAKSCSAALSALGQDKQVVEDCDPNDPWCSPPTPDRMAAADLACGDFTDLGAALVGMEPGQAWLTRLELELRREDLDVDRALAPHGAEVEVQNHLLAEKIVNAPCREPLFTGSNTAMAFGALFGVYLGRRGRRRGVRPE